MRQLWTRRMVVIPEEHDDCSMSYLGPEMEDICWVIVGKCLCKVLIPFVATVRGRAYTLQAGLNTRAI